jgi:hypothetical protein
MIMMKSPSLVLNSHDVPWPKYRMWETVNLEKGATDETVVNHIIRVNRLALEHEQTQLLNVVINCHGAPGQLSVGGDGFKSLDKNNLGRFGLLAKRNIGTLWLVACNAAAEPEGKHFCQMLAHVSKCLVVAADKSQSVGVWGGLRILQGGGGGQIDEYEGNVFSFAPMGMMGVIDPHEDVPTTLE